MLPLKGCSLLRVNLNSAHSAAFVCVLVCGIAYPRLDSLMGTQYIRYPRHTVTISINLRPDLVKSDCLCVPAVPTTHIHIANRQLYPVERDHNNSLGIDSLNVQLSDIILSSKLMTPERNAESVRWIMMIFCYRNSKLSSWHQLLDYRNSIMVSAIADLFKVIIGWYQLF